MSGDEGARAAETDRLWAEMAAAHALPQMALIDLHFVAGEGADATEFMGWLEDAGYDVEHYPADPDGEDGPEPETIEAQTPPVPLSLDRVHAEERRASEGARRFGFVPTGWGFMSA